MINDSHKCDGVLGIKRYSNIILLTGRHKGKNTHFFGENTYGQFLLFFKITVVSVNEKKYGNYEC